MNQITLRFSHGGGIFSNLISWKGSGEWSHVDAVYRDERLFGARMGGGVRFRDADSAGPRFRDVGLPCSSRQELAFWRFLSEQEGKPYDTRAIRAFVYGVSWENPDKWFCSELQAAALVECGWFEWPLIVAANKVDPCDLLLAISVKVRLAQ